MANTSADRDGAAVTLDLWLTLIAEPEGGAFSRKRRELRVDGALETLAAHGERFERSRIVELLDQTSSAINSGHADGVDKTFEDRVIETLSALDAGLPGRLGASGLREFGDAVDESFDRWPPSLIPGALDALESLSKTGVKLGVISNTGFSSKRAYGRFFKSTGLDAFFEVVTLSNDVASAKPSPAMFTDTLKSLGVAPSRAIHVGDNPVADVAGAAAVGMATVWIAGPGRSGVTVQPDYTVSDVTGVPAAVLDWLETAVKM